MLCDAAHYAQRNRNDEVYVKRSRARRNHAKTSDDPFARLAAALPKDQCRVTVEQFRELSSAGAKKQKRHKHNARKVEIDGIIFQSAWEGRRYGQLKLLERAGEISALQLQVEFRIEINGHLITRYFADFVYQKDGAQVVEDAKGWRTTEYIMKKKMIKALFGISILETRADGR